MRDATRGATALAAARHDDAEIRSLATEAKRIARRYYDLTGKPLGITGEIAELEASRLLGLTLAPARQAGWDAVGRRADGSPERLQIKGRWLVNGLKTSARVGAIEPHDDFDAVLLVLLDRDLHARSIHRLERDAVRRLLERAGSIARNVRGQMSIGTFIRTGTLLWERSRSSSALLSDAPTSEGFDQRLAARLSADGALRSLCGPRLEGEHARREEQLERIVADLLHTESDVESVSRDTSLHLTLGVTGMHYPLRTRPDVVVQRTGGLEILEVKSGRVDDSRFQCVIGASMRAHLDALGCDGLSPWEVEQDLLRLQAYHRVVPTLQSSTLILVDTATSTGRTWSAERVIRTLLTEWAYARAFGRSYWRPRALDDYLLFYNFQRRHSALSYLPPASRLPAAL